MNHRRHLAARIDLLELVGEMRHLRAEHMLVERNALFEQREIDARGIGDERLKEIEIDGHFVCLISCI